MKKFYNSLQLLSTNSFFGRSWSQLVRRIAVDTITFPTQLSWFRISAEGFKENNEIKRHKNSWWLMVKITVCELGP